MTDQDEPCPLTARELAVLLADAGGASDHGEGDRGMNEQQRDELAAIAQEIARDYHDEVAGQDTSERYPEQTGREIVDAIVARLEADGWLLISPEQQAGAIQIEADEMCLCECPCEELTPCD